MYQHTNGDTRDYYMATFGIRLPNRGRQKAELAEAEQNQERARRALDSESQRVLSEVQQQYVRARTSEERIKIYGDGLVPQSEAAFRSALSAYQSNRQDFESLLSSFLDVLKAQLQHTKILQEIAHHHQEEGLLEAQIKQLLGRPQDSPDIVADALHARTLSLSAPALFEKASEHNPDVRSKQASIKQQETQVELAHKNFRPDFNVQYMYQHTNGDTRDYYMATFGVRLPNRGRQKAELAEAQQNQERARRALDSESQLVLSEVQQQYVRARTSEERLKIYSDGLVPQSEATFRSALSAYQSNRQDFESLLSSFLDVLNLDLEYRNELVEHESALAELERLTGADVP